MKKKMLGMLLTLIGGVKGVVRTKSSKAMSDYL